MLRTTIFTVFTMLAAAIFVKSALVNPSVTQQLKIYRDRVNMLYLILERECPDTVIANPQLNKREVIGQSSDDETTSALLYLEKKLLNEIIQELVKCRATNPPTTITKPSTTRPSTTKSSTTKPPTTKPTTTKPSTTKPTTTKPSTTKPSTTKPTTTKASTTKPTTTEPTTTKPTTTIPTTTKPTATKPTTTKPTTTEPSTTKPFTTKPTTTSGITTQHPVCSHATGYIKMSLDLVNYRNPSNNKATGATCDAKNGSGCDVYLEICVSPLRESNCSVYHTITEVVGSDWSMSFTSYLGGIANPLILDMGEQTSWKGVNILVTVWHKNINQNTDDLVDEFNYDDVDSPGSPSRNVNLPSSTDKQPKSLLVIGARTYCASLVTSKTTPTTITTTPKTSTTTPTTSTATPRKTTVIPALQACASAVNLTESWRRDSAGSDLHPVNGAYNCDTRDMVRQGRPWFRFSGAAGNRLLDKCSRYGSCGTDTALWSSDPMPDDVGVEALISVSLPQDSGSYSCKPWRRYSRVSVMRCSTRQYDFIYRYDDYGTSCNWGFCGMS